MFDIGFWELTVIGVVALIVIGPERLPALARTIGLWVGRMRGFVLSVKADIDQELRAEELKRLMEQQAKSTGLHEIIEETRDTLHDIDKPDYLVKADKRNDDKASPIEKSAEDKPKPIEKPADDKTKQDDGGKS